VAVLGLLAFLFVGALPLLPLLARPLTRHPTPWVQLAGRVTAMLLLWITFDVSLMATWGAVRFVPVWWAVLLGAVPLQVAAAWLSYRVAFDES